MKNIISIITPSLNQGQFIEQTINSVLSQEGDFTIEYIIADGGSNDNTLDVIKKYDYLLKKNKFPVKCDNIIFRWWSKPDSGQAKAINQGFKLAQGSILAWINSDDYYEDLAFDFVAKQFSLNPDLDIIYGNCSEINLLSEIKTMEVITGDFQKSLEEGFVPPQPASFFHKKIINRVGLLDETYHYSMDYEFFLRILSSGGKIRYFPKNLAYFRVWPNSKTKSKQAEFAKDEKRIRKKYHGSFINPIAIHNLRLKFSIINKIKKKFPNFYYFFKKYIYKIINFIHY